MDQAEASGKTVEDALSRALSRLGATAEEVEIIILDEGKRGFLGRGGRDAMVRVERKTEFEPVPARSEPPDTRIPHGPAAAPGRQRQPRNRRGPRPGGRQSADTAAPKLTAEDFLKPRQERAERGDRPERARQAPAEGRQRRDRRERNREDEPRIDPNINAEEVDFAAGIVDDLLRILDINAEISIREPVSAGDGLGNALAVIDIMGEDLGLLIGRRGETLLSLQYLVNLIVGRRYPHKGSVTIDVEHYRHRREEQVIALAQRMAERVKETGAPITLEPMTPAERRLVHIAFVDDEEVETNSVGEGDHRKVVISLRHGR